MIKVLLVDDHVLARLGLTEAIEADGNMKVIAEAANGFEALQLYPRHRPDVVVMGARMPGQSGAETIRELRQEHPEARVLMLSVYEGEEDIWQAVSAGATGYLSKAVDTKDLAAAVSAVARGQSYFPARIAQKLERRRTRSDLTAQEMAVLECVVRGLSNKEISDQLGISLRTVKFHLTHVLAKLGVADRTQAAVAAVQRGIIHLDD